VKAKYLVTWNCDDSEASFATFPEALACYREHALDRFGCRVWGEYPDDESNGLTSEENEAIEEVDESLTVFMKVG
jgi:hypothetical protein